MLRSSRQDAVCKDESHLQSHARSIKIKGGEMTTAQEIEDWRVKIKKKIWSEFAAEPNEAHGKFLMKKFDELRDTALFGISINSQTTEGTDALAKRQEAEEKHLDDPEMWAIQLDHTEQIWGLCRTYEQRLKVIEAETVEWCVAWLQGAQVEESGRLILTRDFIVANLRALSPNVDQEPVQTIGGNDPEYLAEVFWRNKDRRIRGERRIKCNRGYPIKRSSKDRRKS